MRMREITILELKLTQNNITPYNFSEWKMEVTMKRKEMEVLQMMKN